MKKHFHFLWRVLFDSDMPKQGAQMIDDFGSSPPRIQRHGCPPVMSMKRL
jgi:hypothetical protein